MKKTEENCGLFKPGPARAEEARDDEKWEKSDQGGGEATQPPVVLEIDVSHAEIDNNGSKRQKYAVHLRL